MKRLCILALVLGSVANCSLVGQLPPLPVGFPTPPAGQTATPTAKPAQSPTGTATTPSATATPTAGACKTPALWFWNFGVKPAGDVVGKPNFVWLKVGSTEWFRLPGWNANDCGAPACGDWAARCEAVQAGCCHRDFDDVRGPVLTVTDGTSTATLPAGIVGPIVQGAITLSRPANPFEPMIRAKRAARLTVTVCPPIDFRTADGIAVNVNGGYPGDVRGCLTKTFAANTGT